MKISIKSINENTNANNNKSIIKNTNEIKLLMKYQLKVSN